MSIKYLSIGFILLLTSNSYGFMEQSPTGFLWYNEVVEQDIRKQKQTKQILSSNQQKKPIFAWDRNIEDLKERFDIAQRRALDNPTLSNVIQAQRLQKQIMEKSEKFAVMWQLATLIDHGLINFEEPSNSLHKKIQEQKQRQHDDQKLRLIAKNWGLIFQFSHSCAYCHSFAPVIKEFAAKYHFQLLAVSKSGGDFMGIEGIREMEMLSASGLNPKQIVPVLYLVSSSADKIYPIARGITNENKIIENIMMIDKNYHRLVQ